MQRGRIRCALAASAMFLSGWMQVTGRAQSQEAQPATAPVATKGPSTQEINDALVQRLSRQIAGHDQEPAGQVFKNIQLEFFKTTPAARLLLIMNLGYASALGVNCTYCHNQDDFSQDVKRPKRAAREMALMHFSVNQQLAKMRELEPNPQGHFINCSTCHRGSAKPKEEE